MQELITWMQSTGLAQFMANWEWAWPWAEVLHFVGMSMLFGSILVMDIRLLGFLRRQISLQTVHSLAPLASLGFLINLATGIAFIFKDGDRLLPNVSFQFKMICVLLAGVNLAVFAIKVQPNLLVWNEEQSPPAIARIVAVTSLVAWTLVIWAGRMIPVYGVG